MLMGLALLAASVAISALFAAKKAVAEIEARSDAGGSAVTVTAIVRSGDASRAHLLGGGQAGEWWSVGQAIEGWTITEIRASEVALTSGAISEGEALPSVQGAAAALGMITSSSFRAGNLAPAGRRLHTVNSGRYS